MGKQLKTLSDWEPIVEEWEASDLTATSFCRERGLHVAHFLSIKRRLALRDQVQQKVFEVVLGPTQDASKPAPRSSSTRGGHLQLRMGEVELLFATLPPPQWLSAFLQEVSHAPVS